MTSRSPNPSLGRFSPAGFVKLEQAALPAVFGVQVSSCLSAAFMGSRGLPIRASFANARKRLAARVASAQPRPQRPEQNRLG
ncbi:hypothetical protein DFR37_11340 [Eoetvoesiella caeni]|uniref:Uncharacterized protein n=1 Tax=Eoetvoesiella caeni TaxID=645616 RepID=A0A366H5N4_9BURK|nr:hypothetical protein DFR37_11340 [Eoetvoesiella caeni]